MATTNDLTEVVKGIVTTYIKPKRPIYKVNFINCYSIWDEEKDEPTVVSTHHIKLLEMHKMADLPAEGQPVCHNRNLGYLGSKKYGKIFKVLVDYWEKEIKSKNLKCFKGSCANETYIILDIERVA
tara:strand:- start:1495 stop:1872 length:378 start_codon:yes stop_codon:yes gene_type:complete